MYQRLNATSTSAPTLDSKRLAFDDAISLDPYTYRIVIWVGLTAILDMATENQLLNFINLS